MGKSGSVNVWLLSAAAFLYMAGVGATLAVFPVAVKAAGGSDLDVGLVIGAWSLIYLLANIPAGMVLDKAGPSRLVPLGFGMNILVSALYMGGSIPLYLAGRGLEGVLEALAWTGVFGYTAKENKEGVLASFGTVYGSMALGFTLGPSLGSALYSAAGEKTVFASLGLFSLAAGAAAWAALRGVEPPRSSRGRILPPLGGLRHPVAALSVALAFLIGMFESNLVSYSPGIAAAVGLPESGGGYVISTYYLASLVSQFGLRVTHGMVEGSLWPLLAYTVVLAGLASARSGLGLAAAIAVAGFVDAATTSRIQARLSGILEGAESTAIGLGNASWALGYTTGAPLHASLAPWAGPVEWLFVMAAAMFAAAAALSAVERLWRGRR